MNIFVLDKNAATAAKMQCDKHVVKMCLESAQMLSTIMGGPYKPTHAKHPCTLWAGKTNQNFSWLYAHFKALCSEYTYRYSKIHKSEVAIEDHISAHGVPNLPDDVRTEFAQAMPVELKNEDPVKAYQALYKHKAKTIKMVWTKRDIPDWFTL